MAGCSYDAAMCQDPVYASVTTFRLHLTFGLGCTKCRYSPPEDLVMPEKTPRAPLPLLAITLSPFAWFYGRPDLFDSYRYWMLHVDL